MQAAGGDMNQILGRLDKLCGQIERKRHPGTAMLHQQLPRRVWQGQSIPQSPHAQVCLIGWCLVIADCPDWASDHG